MGGVTAKGANTGSGLTFARTDGRNSHVAGNRSRRKLFFAKSLRVQYAPNPPSRIVVFTGSILVRFTAWRGIEMAMPVSLMG